MNCELRKFSGRLVRRERLGAKGEWVGAFYTDLKTSPCQFESAGFAARAQTDRLVRKESIEATVARGSAKMSVVAWTKY